jgi:tetratricopeptide (TPR) repeat protein
VRAYAREKLAEAGEGDALSDRHVDWVLAWLRRAIPRPFGAMFPIPAIEELARSIGDVSAACEWSLAQADVARAPELITRAAPLFIPLSRPDETLSAVERALALPQGGEPEWRLLLRHALSRILAVMGRFTDAFRVGDALLPELEAGRHRGALASTLDGLVIASEASGLGDPLALIERAIEASRAAADPVLEADALTRRGEHELVAARHGEALASFERAAALAPADEGRAHYIASRRALAAVLSGDSDLAGELARRANSETWPGAAADPATTSARNAYLLANAAAGDADATAERMRQAIDLQRRLRAPLADADLLATLGGVACLTGDFERGARLLGAARGAFGLHGSWRTNAGGAVYLHFGAQVRRALPADVAKRARDAGRALSVEEAFEHALAMLPPA